MAKEFLLNFLEVGIIDLSGDDSKLEKLRETTKDISAALRKAATKTSSLTMVAADPTIASTDPTIVEAMEALKKQWQTISNTHRSPPVAILRAILLDAIMQAARADDAIAVAFVNTARNALAHAPVADEADIWRTAINEIETKVDARAEAEWETPEMISVAPLKFGSPSQAPAEYQPPSINRTEMQTKIFSATGPWGGQDQNPYQPNQGQHWGQTFAERMTVVIAEALESMATDLAPVPVDLSKPLSTLASAVSTHVDEALASFSTATAGLQRRTNLLWWKEAMYSPSAHASYQDLPLFEAAALMALDLHEQVPTYSPASVSALLKQTIQALSVGEGGQDASRREFASLVQDAISSTHMETFRSLAAAYAPAPKGRGPLLSLIGNPQDAKAIEPALLRAYAGVDALKAMSASEWGTHLFRELQAARATSLTKRAKKK
ncbi:hypothetical protein GJV26_20310 [Massilia dura]|uniref:GTPase-associated system helical domain-containing protein n=1 Tax=Pseudoduganella dura TaxID=321982 RepID=A0A6I3XQD5_9BURK|nr:GTPase-associated system all-helical protein GASH [Pseudoduganella dura]MUI14788.1 hypothetical protein [Pseudoduganella dura]GGX98024.1 hypothetical protein GCM10007386_31120 [Pseudoduganella dura]